MKLLNNLSAFILLFYTHKKLKYVIRKTIYFILCIIYFIKAYKLNSHTCSYFTHVYFTAKKVRN